MKKVLLLALVLGLGIFFATGCKHPRKEKTLEEKIAYTESLKDQLVLISGKYEINTEDKKAEEIKKGVALLSKDMTKIVEDYKTEVQTLLAKKKEEVVEKDVDDLINRINQTLNNIQSQIVYGTKVTAYEETKEGLLAAQADLRDLLNNLGSGAKPEYVKIGIEFITDEVRLEAAGVVKKVKDAVNASEKDPADKDYKELTVDIIKEIIAEIQEQLDKVVKSIKLGKQEIISVKDVYKVDLEKLNLDGEKIYFYTHARQEDDPYSETFKSDTFSKDEYKKYLDDLQKKYNFKLEFKSYQNEETTSHSGQLKTHVQSSNNAAIARLNNAAKVTASIANGAITNIEGVLESLQKQYNDEYIIAPWQVEKGTVLGKKYGIQRNDATAFPDIMFFNRTFLKAKGLKDDQMPDKLWLNNQWTFAKMQEIAQTVGGNCGQDEYAVALIPMFAAIQAVNASGLKLLDVTKENIDDQFNFNNQSVKDIVSAWETELKKTYNTWKDNNKQEIAESISNGTFTYKSWMFDLYKTGKVGIGALQEWQMGGIVKDTTGGDIMVVPFPQNLDAQDNSKYLQPIDSGDVLAVTAGGNHHKVATILMLINKFMKGANKKYLDKTVDSYGNMPANPTEGEIYAAKWVKEKLTSVTTPEATQEARKIVAFIFGYKTSVEGNQPAYTIADELSSIGAIETYAIAVTKAFNDGTDYVTELAKNLDSIKADYENIIKVVNK